MDKFLFTDGSSGVREIHSKEELIRLLNALPSPAQARIWLYSTGEWIPYSSFIMRFKDQPDLHPVAVHSADSGRALGAHEKKRKRYAAPLLMLGIAVSALLVFNFASAKWVSSGKFSVSAGRPVNVPVMDPDSLAAVIESQRGRLLDKSTRNNLRLRNNWPEQILLRLEATRETRNGRQRFSGITVQIDNATGFQLDRAIVKLQGWKNGKPFHSDTLQFSRIRYDKVLTRELAESWLCDSLSITFSEIRSAAFNFCYTSQAKHNSGNYNDRWFCREGRPAE